MKRKLFILQMAFILVCGIFQQAYAAESLGDLWSSKRQNVTEEEGYIHLDKKECYEGRASMRIYFKNAYHSQTYTKLESTQNITFNMDKTYLFECYAKSAGPGSKMFGKIVWDWTDKGKIDVSSTEWTYFSETFTPGSTSNKLGIVFENPCNGWIDNLSVRVLDDEGNPTGGNLLENGGFEMCDFEAPAEVSDYDTDGQDGAVVLSWTNPADEDLSAVNVYEFDDSGEKLVQTVIPKGKNSQLKIEGLENGKLYYYRIRTQDTSRNESRGIEIYGAPIIDRYYTMPIIASAGNEPIENLRQGDISFSTTVTNNRAGSNFKATLITAVYDEMRLVELKISEAAIHENESARLENVISIPEGYENFSVESYLWSDTESMESLYRSKILVK